MKYASGHPTLQFGSRHALTALEMSAVEARFGLRLSARLNEQAQAVPHDISERLRIAREAAVASARLHARSTQMSTAPALMASGGGTSRGLLLGAGGGDAWWFKLSSIVPLVVLVAGLFLIQHLEGEEQILVAADVDTALLGDELPPDAYADPGFGEFLKMGAPASAEIAPTAAN